MVDAIKCKHTYLFWLIFEEKGVLDGNERINGWNKISFCKQVIIRLTQENCMKIIIRVYIQIY